MQNKERENNLYLLNALYEKETFEVMLVYGQHRIDKLSLIRNFCKDKHTIWFCAQETDLRDNMSLFSFEIKKSITVDFDVSFENFKEMVNKIVRINQSDRIILVIDDFRFLLELDSSFFETLNDREENNIFIILSGSFSDFVKLKNVSSIIEILPLNYLETSKARSNFLLMEKMVLFGITGGIPFYISKFLNFHLDVSRNFFNLETQLYEEPRNYLLQIYHNIKPYDSILSLMNDGYTIISEISKNTGINTGNCIKYLNKLILHGIVRKETPFYEKGSRSVYYISNHLFRFCYRFVQPNMSAIAAGCGEDAYRTFVEPHLTEFLEPVFRQICEEYLMIHYGHYWFQVAKTGTWWGIYRKTRYKDHIDIIMADETNSEAIYGQCQFNEEPMDVFVLFRLLVLAHRLVKKQKRHFFLFSKSGFTERLIKRAKISKVTLVTLDDLFQVD